MEPVYQQLKVKFRDDVDTIKRGPAEERSLNDPCCYVFFVLVILTFFVLGLFVMADQSSSLREMMNSSGGVDSSNVIGDVFSKYPGLISVMLALSIVIAVLYLILVRYCLRCVVYTMVVAMFCILFAILVMGIYSNNFGLIVAMSVSIVFFILFLICMRNEFQLGMKLMEIAGRFIGERPEVYMAGVWVFFLSCLFFVFWAVSVVAVQMHANMHKNQGVSNSGDMGILGFFIFVYIFMGIFFYYVLSFLISTACAMWYYAIDGGFFCTATGRINRYHIGSFTFGALLLTIVRIMQIIINSSGRQSNNACARCVQCFISCILSQVEHLLRVLNSTAVVVMAVTGENYCNSAKTAAYILFDSLGLYAAVSVISNLVMVGGVVLAVGIPTIVGLLYCKKVYNPTDTELDHLGLLLFFGSIILVVFIIGTLCEALNAIYVFHCLDLRLNECGCVMPTPEVLQDLRNYNQANQAPSAQELQR